MNELFRRFCLFSAQALGNPWVFIANVFLILIWLIVGPLFDFSQEWQLTVNSATTVVTYLAVFILQYTQMRGDSAMQAKLDEIIHSIDKARNKMIEIEEESDEVISNARDELYDVREHNNSRKGRGPDV